MFFLFDRALALSLVGVSLFVIPSLACEKAASQETPVVTALVPSTPPQAVPAAAIAPAPSDASASTDATAAATKDAKELVARIDANTALAKTVFDTECKGLASSAHAEWLQDGVVVQKATLQKVFAGEGGVDTYTFYFGRSAAVFATLQTDGVDYGISDSKGAMGAKVHIVEYDFSGSTPVCRERSARGLDSKAIEASLARAKGTSIACSKPNDVKEVGTLLARGPGARKALEAHVWRGSQCN